MIICGTIIVTTNIRETSTTVFVLGSRQEYERLAMERRFGQVVVLQLYGKRFDDDL